MEITASGLAGGNTRPASLGPSTGLLGQIGGLQVRLAVTDDERTAAQRLRYQIFIAERGARAPDCDGGRDEDRFDAVCDHLIVIDTHRPGRDADNIIGTYRLLRDDAAVRSGGFYSASEYRIESLIARHPCKRFLELGRSCVLPAYRSKRTIELLWQGIWAYCLQHDVDVMVGCASFPGVVPAAHALPLSFLHQHASAPTEWNVAPAAPDFTELDMMPVEAIDARAALAAMPPLIKGYLRLGAKFSDFAVVDPAFGTTDVMVILPVETISDRYVRHYGSDAGRFAPAG
nr:GNAT family N-acetyltransferase [Oricola cellulosilytica]